MLDLKSSSEQIFSENCRWVPLNDEVVGCYTLEKEGRALSKYW